MIKIFHAPRTRSMRVIWLCEELGVPYEVVPIEFRGEYRNSEEWRKLSPTGKVPAMADDGFSMFESGAMVQYNLERYGQGRLRPQPGTADSAHFLQWCWFAEATLARPLGDIIHHTLIKPEEDRIPAVVADATDRARLCLDALEAALEGQEYLVANTFSAADIMTGYSLMLAGRLLDVLDERYTNLCAYLAGLESRPGYAKAME